MTAIATAAITSRRSRAGTWPVVVVGAGPAGLVTATTLARHGIDVLVLDRRTRPSPLPRAVGLSLRHMELLRSWGLEHEILAGGEEVELAVLETVTAAESSAGLRREMNVPTRTQASVVSPTSAARVAQDHVEQVLLAHLASFPCAQVRRGVEVSTIAERDDVVELEVRDLGTGAVERVGGEYVVAADGAHSTVRAGLGISMIGPSDVMCGVSVDFEADLWPVVGDHRFALYAITHPEGAGVLIPTGRPGRWQYGMVVPPDGADVATSTDPAWVHRRVIAAIGAPEVAVAIGRIAAFSSAAQLAERFSTRRVILAGDAAHRVTPRGGNGLALAIRSAIDVSWRLAWVVHGWAPLSFLDTYDDEARPVAADSVARAADPNGFCRAVISEMLLDLGGRLQHAWLAPGVSTLDVVGPALTLLTADLRSKWRAAARTSSARVPVEVVDLPRSAAHALGLQRPDAAMLIRPDGVPVASWWSADDAVRQLDRAVAALLRPSRRTGARAAISELDDLRAGAATPSIAGG